MNGKPTANGKTVDVSKETNAETMQVGRVSQDRDVRFLEELPPIAPMLEGSSSDDNKPLASLPTTSEGNAKRSRLSLDGLRMKMVLAKP